jgi:glucose-1-phosphate cytidylyltransferase
MRVIILAGGLGTRISEETADKPKPMVLLNDKPILWHIMSIYAKQGHTDFAIAAGYKGEIISDWASKLETNWNIQTINTGLETQTGGRIKSCMQLFPGERVMATYGDGVANVDINRLLAFHDSHGKLVTLTAVHPPARFGYLNIANGIVKHFGEKNQSDAGWINGGFFVIEPEVSDLVKSLDEPFETGALPRLVSKGSLMAFHHEGFWQPMDTFREMQDLSNLAKQATPPWLAGI